MERSKVIVHMYVSIDGKIDGPHGSEFSGAYYADELFNLSNADGNGCKTISMYAAQGELDLTCFDGNDLSYTDWIPEVDSETWSVAFDRKGRCAWQTNYFEYNGHRMHAIEIVTKQAPKAYLAFLRSMQIPYIVSGTSEFDLNEVLLKLKRYFGIETLALCGGATINGVFLKAHLVDEISLVVSPTISGDNSIKSAFDTQGEFVPDTFSIKQIKPLEDGSVHLRYQRDE